MNPIIISAKAAKKHLEKIKGVHRDIVESMKNQAMRVELFNQNQDQIQRDQSIRNDEMIQKDKDREFNHKEKTADRDFNTQKASMDYNLKTKELAVKEAALNQPDI